MQKPLLLALPKLPGLCPNAQGSPHKAPAPRQGTLAFIVKRRQSYDIKESRNT